MDERPGEGPAGPPGSPRVRWRLVVAVLVAAAMVASGRWLDGLGAASAATPRPRGPVSGAWFCPHGGHPGWRGWVVVANPGSTPVRVRLTSTGAKGTAAPTSLSVPPGSERQVAVPAHDPAATTEVEYFGGFAAASAVLQGRGRLADIAAERCVAASRATWFAPDVATPTGTSSYLVVANPFSTTAVFDVTLRTELRAVHPGPLSPDVLKPHTATAVRVNAWVEQGPGEHTVSAQVRAGVGRVVVGALSMAARGGGLVRAASAVAGGAAEWTIPAAGYGGAASLGMANAGGRATKVVLQSVTPSGRSAIGPAVPLASWSVRTDTVGGIAGGGVQLQAASGQPIVPIMQLEGPRGGSALLTGTAHPATRWVVPAIAASAAGRETLVLENPGTTAVRASVRLFGSGGAGPEVPALTVPAGRIVTVELWRVAGDRSVAALVTASGGVLAVSAVATAWNGRGFAATAGVPAPG